MAFKEKVLKGAGEVISHKAILEIDFNNKAENNSFASDNDLKSGISKVSNALNQKVTNFLDTPGKLTPYVTKAKNALGIENRGLKDGVIVVQYNPASIKYHATTSEKKTNKKEQKYGQNFNVLTITNTSNIEMSFTLVFHSSYPTDQSVREQMELILNMIQRSPSQKVKFSWANMQTEGKLVSFTGVYDMFDMTGTPISGHMDMTIKMELTIERTKKTLDKLDEEHKDKLADK